LPARVEKIYKSATNDKTAAPSHCFFKKINFGIKFALMP